MSLTYKRLELEDLREFATAPLGSKPILSRSLPAWYVELVELYEFYEYIDCILPRRYSNA